MTIFPTTTLSYLINKIFSSPNDFNKENVETGYTLHGQTRVLIITMKLHMP